MLGKKLKASNTCLALDSPDSSCHRCANDVTMLIPIKIELSHLKTI